jgi:hypothetical protein
MLMGRYQQWLHYQEVDQQLRSRLELLETELAQLQAQAHTLAEVHPTASNNVIIQSLLTYRNAETAPDASNTPNTHDTQVISTISEPVLANETLAELTPTHYIPAEPLLAPVSPALLAWSRLYLDAQKMPVPSLDTSRSGTSPSPAEADLLPEDMATFLNKYTSPVPQPRLPTWLENVISAPPTSDQLPNNPVDQQTLRTNRLVERWLERWRKTSSSSQEQQEDQEDESHR